MNTRTSFSYLLIGSGRLAQHLAHYLNLLNIPHETWDRAQDPHALNRKIASSSHVLLGISDSALAGFYRQHLAGHDKVVVHFSGAQNFAGMISAHPLMTFGPELYDLNFYKNIHFMITDQEEADSDLKKVLPGLPNSYNNLSVDKKALYHASCVIGGNFTTLLLAKMLENFDAVGIPTEASRPYIEKVIANTFAAPEKALTGPLVRKDVETVKSNLAALALENTNATALDFFAIYTAFLKTYWPEYPRK